MLATQQETVAQMVRRLAATHLGPYELTKAILAEIGHDPDALRAALEEVLPGFCRTAIGIERRRQFDLDTTEPEAEEPAEPVVGEPDRRAWVSKKLQRIHDAHVALLAKQYHVADGYRRLGDCSAEDLVFSAEERRAQAAGHLAEAKRLDALAVALRQYSAAKVADLPAQIVDDIMRRES